ncbi:polyketide cyclase [Isoptericola croceus]|uniref:polyketide cyclase n=1 Tax=Isoptericola croceus TaxID=3031406 RepID=UPI0023FA19E5|nr:polyketide cyclase [Isoptericola croceus]
MTTSTDHIERETEIAAPRALVWELVTEPGWWINDGELVEHRIEPDGQRRVVVHDPVHGAFAVRTVTERPQEYVAFRCYSGNSSGRRRGSLNAGASTLVEFHLTALSPTATSLRVVESGFDSLDEDASARRAMLDANTEGWVVELDLARLGAEGGVA